MGQTLFHPPAILTIYYKLTLNKLWFLLHSYNNFYFEENDFFGFNCIFLLKTYVITHTPLKTYVIAHTAKTHLPCYTLKCFNQIYYYASISLLFSASVVLVTWLSKYSKYFETDSHTAYTCSLSRFMCGFEKYQSKYSNKLFTLTWVSAELIGLGLCLYSFGLLKFIKFFIVISGKVHRFLDFSLL